jgi:hypothetical protein
MADYDLNGNWGTNDDGEQEFVSTVGSGGDYADLETWVLVWDDIDAGDRVKGTGEPSYTTVIGAEFTAEGLAGSDLGAVNLFHSGANYDPSATHHPVIRAASGDEANGLYDTAGTPQGAFLTAASGIAINASVMPKYLTIEGIRIVTSGSATGIDASGYYNTGGWCKIRRCTFQHAIGANGDIGIEARCGTHTASSTKTYSVYAENNVFYVDGNGQATNGDAQYKPIRCRAYLQSPGAGSTVTLGAFALNNTMVRVADGGSITGLQFYTDDNAQAGTVNLNVVSRNNV